MKHWAAHEVAALQRLRRRFLEGTPEQGNYWESTADLALYDATFAARIGWKWDAVLSELTLRGWHPEARTVIDWGCGSGIASRRVLAHFPGAFTSVSYWDRSPLAVQFAAEKLKEEQPAVQTTVGEGEEGALFLLSHVLNELPEAALAHLLRQVARARELLWVEPGARSESRRLSIEIRAHLHSLGFHLVAPCTHQLPCGMAALGNDSHWCHHFARVPSEVFQDARWAEWSREAGVDLRSLPYSFLAATRETPASCYAEASRVIGHSRDYKGYSKILSCQAEGVSEFTLQKRDAPEVLKEIRAGDALGLYRFTTAGGKITQASRVLEEPT